MTCLTHPNVRVTLDAQKEPSEPKYWQLDGLMGPRQVLVHERALDNLLSALMERLYYEKQTKLPPAPTKPGYIRRTLEDFKLLLCQGSTPATAMRPEQFVACYSSRKRRIYEAAARVYSKHGVQPRDANYRAFVKFEKILEVPGERVVPRLINPRSAVYNVGLGRYLRPLEHRIYRRIARLFEETNDTATPIIAKGFNAEQSAAIIWEKFESFDDPVVIGLDASRFDQHVNSEMLKWEHSVYQKFYPGESELAEILKMQLHNKGTAITPQGTVRFTVEGTRGTGDMNTALGNCLISAAILWTYARSIGVRVDAFINGDDVIVFIERQFSHLFQKGLSEYYMKLGFRMKIEPAVSRMEEIEFCQTHPVHDGLRWIMVRNFPDCLSKDSTIIHHVFAGNGWKDYLASVGECGLSLCAGLPVLEEYYRKLRSLGEAKDQYKEFITTGFQAMSRDLHRQCGITESARESFARAFGVDPQHQRVLEKQISEWSPGGVFSYQDPRMLPL